MRVITLDRDAFVVACGELAELVAASGRVPGVIVGIRTGGAYVADEMARRFPGARREDVTLRRPSTKGKGRLRWLLGCLPIRVLDLLRMAEAFVLRHRRRAPGSLELGDGLVGLSGGDVLVVDDAVDSGVTLATVAGSLREANPGVAIMTAAITVTEREPAEMPDFALYNDKTLIRFPWSMDMKER